MRLPTAVAGSLVCALGCAHGSSIEKLDVDTYRVTCPEASLDRCLGDTASNACDKRAYFVARGISNVNARGRSDAPDVALSSEAVIRCAPGQGWGEQGKELMSAPAASAPAPAASSVSAPASSPPKLAPVCAPGATQPCTGAGACRGGQACKADGSGFERCDCGSATPAPEAAPPAVPDVQ